MSLRFVLSAMVIGGLLTSVAAADKLENRKSPKGAKAYIITPKNGKTVKKKFTVRFGLKGMASPRPPSTRKTPAIITC